MSATAICRSERKEESVLPGETTSSALREGQNRLATIGVEGAPLEAELLLAHALGISRAQLYARLREPLTVAEHEFYRGLVERRFAREPLAYITGHKEFYSIDLLCSPAALIPRPETELLVEVALGWIQESSVKAPTIIDVGTGSGAVAIALAANAPDARVLAIDTSPDALQLAAENVRRGGVSDRVDIIRGSLLEPVRCANVIVANLPYISDDVYGSLAPEIRHEPEGALRAGPRGTELIETLLAQSLAVLAPGGLLVAEHAWDQGAALSATAQTLFFEATVGTKRDLAGLARALVVWA